MSEKKSFTYKDSGVDVKAGEELVESIKSLVRETHNVSVLSDIGGFGGFFVPDFASYKEPVLVSSVDGVGTKLKVSFMTNVYHTVGQDLVNHCVNDIAVCGAKPLFFLDYFSTGKLDKEIAKDVIGGFAIACKENGCALIGGETAEMPDIYSEGEFDLAGTIVGVVDRKKIINGKKVQKNDLLIGFKSTGLHTNGYSLARKVLFSKYTVDDKPDLIDCTVGEALLKIHRSYLSVISELLELTEIHAFSHITGGGIIGNTKRVVPKELSIVIDWNSWSRPAIFNLIQQTGDVPEEDMREAFNLGIGLIAIISPEDFSKVKKWAEDKNEEIFKIGYIA